MDEEITNTEFKSLTRKHIAERQRRARINSYLEEIQGITCNANNKVQKVKLEKAEVLESALAYLQNNQHTEESNNNTIISKEILDINAYEDGYKACMTSFLDSCEDVGLFEEIVPGLKTHLESFLDETILHSEVLTASPKQEQPPMAFSPSLAKLEKCLKKFESGSDVQSDTSYSETASGTNVPDQVQSLQNKEAQGFQNNSELISGYSVNEWVNMQREYVLHQQMLLQQQQYQQYYNQQYSQHQYQIHPTHMQTQAAEDLSKTNNSSMKQTQNVQRAQDIVKGFTPISGKDKTNLGQTNNTTVQVQVWRPW